MRHISSPATVVALPEDRPVLRYLTKVRWVVLAAALALSGVGLATIHSASSELQFDYMPRQAVWVILGLAVFLVGFALDYLKLAKFALPIYLGSLGLLAAVLFIGQEVGGARSWLGLGRWRLQPSELAKVATVLLLARYLAASNQRVLALKEVGVAALIAGVPMVLVGLSPDLGSAAMFVPMLVGMLLLTGVKRRLLIVGALIALVLGVSAWNLVLLDYQKDRVRTFLSPGSDPLGAGYQLRQSKIAVGSGQLTGRGYGQGTQSQLRFLPARHTDFIFAVLAEEWGLLGVGSVLFLFGAYIFNGARVAERARDRTGILLVVGLLSVFTAHMLYNTAMVVGLVPITGIPLPFLSYGGSFTLANFFATGLILGVDFRRYVNR
jgi:rod shape determining protein RodA